MLAAVFLEVGMLGKHPCLASFRSRGRKPGRRGRLRSVLHDAFRVEDRRPKVEDQTPGSAMLLGTPSIEADTRSRIRNGSPCNDMSL